MWEDHSDLLDGINSLTNSEISNFDEAHYDINNDNYNNNNL